MPSPDQSGVTPYFAGVDVGSVTTAAVVLDCRGRLAGGHIVATSSRCARAAEEALCGALAAAKIGPGQVAVTTSTGYGRGRVSGASGTVTEITCHARGIVHLLPHVRFLIDAGGQDCKAVLLDERGRVTDFAMNDRCAAGTGRFFENMCRALEVDLDEFGPLALSGDGRLVVSHVCAVFAESEVVGLLARGEPLSEIAAGLCRAAARQVAALARRVGSRAPAAVSGGVARNAGFVRALESELGLELLVPDEPDLVGALGAALVARESYREPCGAPELHVAGQI